MKKILGLKKKHFIILIVSLCAVALVAEGILLAHISATKNKKNKSTPTPTTDPALEAEYEEYDENAAEEVRYHIEICLASIETYDEMIAALEMFTALASTTDYKEVFVLTNDGLKYLVDLPKMKEYLDEEFADRASKGRLDYISVDSLSEGNVFKSEKYKNAEYFIMLKLPREKYSALEVRGKWSSDSFE